MSDIDNPIRKRLETAPSAGFVRDGFEMALVRRADIEWALDTLSSKQGVIDAVDRALESARVIHASRAQAVLELMKQRDVERAKVDDLSNRINRVVNALN